MIEYLEDISKVDEKEFGKEISDLHKLYINKVDCESTLLISSKIFLAYKKANKQDNGQIKSISKETIEKFKHYEFVDIYSSLYTNIYGIPNFIKIPLNPRIIKDKILEIYNSWFDDRARANRITYSIPEQNTFPSIYIQPNRVIINSFVTRCPKTGQLTNQNNLSNIHNTLNSIDKKHEDLFFNIEKALKRPIKFYYFPDNGKIKIRKVENETMTINAKWCAINDLYFKGLIEKEDFIELLDPNMIYEKNVIKPLSESNNQISVIEGLPASPGISIGQLVFNFSDISKFMDNSIFCCIETSPEDLDKLDRSSAAISARGGMTSHLAVVARGMGKPVVTGASFSINFKNNELIFGEQVFPEFSYVMVDGNKGQIFISKEPISAENNYKASSSYEYLKTSYQIIKSISSSGLFKNYTIEFQLKIANLLSAFNKIQFTK